MGYTTAELYFEEKIESKNKKNECFVAKKIRVKQISYICVIMFVMERKPLYKIGDEVAHVDNLQMKMYVDRIIKKGMKEPTGKMLDGKPVMQSYRILIGIECHWWQEEKDTKTFMKCKFHSRELLRWEDAVRKQQRYDKSKI